MTTTEFYEKEFSCGQIRISRYNLEMLSESFCTRDLTDTEMQSIVDQIFQESKVKIDKISLPFLYQRNKEKNKLILETIFSVLRERNVPEYDNRPDLDRFDKALITLMNPNYVANHYLYDKHVLMVNSWISKIESVVGNLPKEGDIVRYTSKDGDYKRTAMLERISLKDKKADVYTHPDIPFLLEINNQYRISLGGGDQRQIDTELLVNKGTTYTYFKDWGFRAAYGTIQFPAKVNVWEYKDPYPKYGEFTTKDYRKFYVYKREKGEYAYSGDGLHFKTKQDFIDYSKFYHGTTFLGNYENQIVFFCYKIKRLELTASEWEQLKLPIADNKYISKSDGIKYEADHEKHCMNFYYVKEN